MPHSRARGFVSFALATATVAAQSVWSQVPTLVAPAARGLHGTAYDVIRARTVLFGGETATTSIAMLGDTWEFDGQHWTQALPATSPVARWGHSMVYDPLHARTYLFGGCVGTAANDAVLDDTWAWDGVSWTQLAPATHPLARTAAAMVHDSLQGRTLLFGGRTNTPQAIVYFGDVWSFDGTNWTQLPGSGPTGRCAMGLAFDPDHAELVMFGGVNTATRGDTWTWNGAWTQRVVTGPSARWGQRMVHDPLNGRVLLVGGNTGPTQTWSWSGSAWTQLTTTGPSRFNHALEFDYLAGRPTILSGESAAPPTGAEVWTYGTPIPGSFVPFGTGCSGALGVPTLSRIGALPVIGGSLQLRAANVPALAVFVIGFSNTSWNGIPLPLDGGLVDMPNCTFYVSADLLFAAAATSNAATMALSIPFEYAFVGLPLYLHAASFDPTANAIGLALSNAATATLGRP